MEPRKWSWSKVTTRLAAIVAMLGGHLGPVAAASHADFGGEDVSPPVREIADWVVDSRNNAGLPFVVVDKVGARVFVFTVAGVLRGAAPVLLGSASGDDSAPGIGAKKLVNIPPAERTTPAGRFVAEMGLNMRGQDILWIDYDTSVSLHRVITGTKEHRQQRLDTPTPSDNRITYGCINVSETFYTQVVRPMFSKERGIVYVLPEVRAIRDVFHSYYVDSPNSRNN